MMNTSTCTDINSLPPDVFDLKHEDFYHFVDYECGPIQSKILKFQLISDADIFLECTNPTEILQYNNEKLDELKAESCLMTDEKSFIVFPGIVASFNSLKKRLLKKIDENIKEAKRNKVSVNVTASTPSAASTSSTTSTTTQSKSIDDFRSHIIKSIDQWLDKYKDDLNLQADCSLTESVDYTIEFKHNFIGQQSVVITCTCGSKTSLCRSTGDGYYKLSNFYRHLERGTCSTMKKKVKTQGSQNSTDLSISTDRNSNENRHTKRPISINENNRDRINKRRRR